MDLCEWKQKTSRASECERWHTWDGAALKKIRRSFQANRYPRTQQCSMLRGCTTANSPTCTLPKIFSTSSSAAVRRLIIAAGGDLQNRGPYSHFTSILFSCPLYKHNPWDISLLICCFWSQTVSSTQVKVLFDYYYIRISLQDDHYSDNFWYLLKVTRHCKNEKCEINLKIPHNATVLLHSTWTQKHDKTDAILQGWLFLVFIFGFGAGIFAVTFW